MKMNRDEQEYAEFLNSLDDDELDKHIEDMSADYAQSVREYVRRKYTKHIDSHVERFMKMEKQLK